MWITGSDRIDTPAGREHPWPGGHPRRGLLVPPELRARPPSACNRMASMGSPGRRRLGRDRHRVGDRHSPLGRRRGRARSRVCVPEPTSHLSEPAAPEAIDAPSLEKGGDGARRHRDPGRLGESGGCWYRSQPGPPPMPERLTLGAPAPRQARALGPGTLQQDLTPADSRSTASAIRGCGPRAPRCDARAPRRSPDTSP